MKETKMEDLWMIQDSMIDTENFEDKVEYERFLGRFGKEGETSKMSKHSMETSGTRNNAKETR